ncbi:MAG: aspartate aminotransferase family protein [Bacteroidales bacterium]|nr:aspartate aminotransferase family protein [Bacteroidales bacterium]MCF8405051.1 aspartate aminotransferase family protein [Bacteroidales bacterium]
MITNKEIFYRHLGLPSAAPSGIEINRAKGIYMYDTLGKEYIDLVSGVSVSNIGHLHPEVVKAITEQLNKYMHLMVYGEYIQSPQVKLAKLLTENLPKSLDCTYFVNSGSEAIEGALKLAKRYSGRTEIIAYKNAYHGGTHGALSILGNEKLKFAFRPLLPDIKFLDFNNPDQLEEITDKTACVVIEAIQAEAGIILPKENYLSLIRKRCDETSTLLILDDIQMGFGRTGKLFSFEHFNFTPDILCLAKGMGGGMPIGAFISSKERMNSFTSDPELGHITTFGGHPVSCAAALANLKVLLDDRIFEKAETMGNIYRETIINHPKIKAIRNKGLMLGIDLENEKLVTKLQREFIKNGLITDRFLFRPFAFRIAPPLIITEDEIAKSIDLINRSLLNL